MKRGIAVVVAVVALFAVAARFSFAQSSTAQKVGGNVPTLMTPSGLTVEEVRLGRSCVVIVSGRGTNVAVAPCTSN